ncbi:carbohydrate binding protein with CBM6 domain [Mariniflexile fucanivorans]|uniref:Carbohydrate binding protein with CBM6 domain n=1 Tax=Mariniflexile fucanivorans TaxID=264023 RepID=A0A4V2QE33_9FLAO|nr:family 43 glycosylhydrolase [Mariniflexile fucanivorans]TCL66287.1 carbohydrate binding protein with CBM6 domain [Mariniflexile fucanivorans]
MTNFSQFKKISFYFFLVNLIYNPLIFSQNPIIGNIGISDPHVRIFNDTIFLFSGHDDTPDDKTWIMKNWRIFSTTDLVHWDLRETIHPKDNYMDNNSTDCWASDAASRNGSYYFYFSDRKRGVGVMVADSPSGPYKDPLGKPLVSPMHDPTILVDDDVEKTPYIIYGDKEGGGFHVAKLNDNMISLADTPKPITIHGEGWRNAPIWMDKNYIFKHKNTYYLSWGQQYAISKNIYGPYQYVGSVGSGFNLNEFAHGSFFWWKGQFYHMWCYYQKSGYKYRETIISYCHFDDEGNLVTDTRFLEKHFKNGVGQYDASWDKIEAEWYYEISEGITKQGNKTDGFSLTNINDGGWIRFSNVNSNSIYKKITANLSLKGEKGFLEIRTDSIIGNIIGKTDLSQSDSLQEVSCKLKGFMGKRDIFIKFRGANGSRMKLDWFKFEKE